MIKKSEHYYKKCLELIKELDIKNIRVIKKINWIIKSLWSTMETQEERLVHEWLTHVVLLSLSYYQSKHSVSLDFIQERLHGSSWLSSLTDKAEQTDEEKKYRSISTNLYLNGTDYDDDLVSLLKFGIIDKINFKNKIESIAKNIERDIVDEKLKSAWKIYSDSFSDNSDEFILTMKNILDDDIDKIGLTSFTSVIDILDDLGENTDPYIEKYFHHHETRLKDVDLSESWGIGRIKRKDIIERIETLQKDSKPKNIDEISLKLYIKNGWSPEDLEFLSSITSNDYYDWMKSSPEMLHKKIRDGLLTFKGLKSSNDEDTKKYQSISDNVEDALKKIATLNDFNKKRVKHIYGIDIDQ